MRINMIVKRFYLIIFIALNFIAVSAQKNISSVDSLSKTTSDKWELKSSRKLFGDIKRLEFGPYAILSIEKLGSPVIKRKIKDGPELQLLFGYDAEQKNDKNVFVDVTRKVTVEKTKFYRMLSTNNVDTIESLCSVLSASTEERRTVLGTILNGSNDNGPSVVGTAVNKKGFIITNTDQIPWSFSYQFASSESKRMPLLSGYLKNNSDSFYVKPIVGIEIIEFRLFKKTNIDTIYRTQGISLLNQKGEQVAVYQYPKVPATSNRDNKYYIWMRKDLENSYRQAITSYWSTIIAL